MAAAGSGGYGGPNFAQINNDLRNIAIQFGSILSITQQMRASIEVFRNFERELTLANFAAGGTAVTFGQMNTAARNMALGSVNSVGQLAYAFGNLARAGLSASEVLSAATGVMLLANATMTDLGEASDTTASTMAQFNLRADESGRIANLFVAASNNSLASMNKLSFAMRQVGPIAAQANLSLETTVAMLDKLFDAGLRGEQAGTALRNTITRLINPVGEGATILKNVGISAFGANGEIDVENAIKKMAELNLSVQDVTRVVGTEAAAGVLTLMNSFRAGNETLDEHRAKISGTNDAYRQALASMNTLDSSLRQAGNAFAELQIVAGEQLAPILITLSQGLVDIVLSMRELDTNTGATIVQMVALGGLVAVLIGGVGAVPRAFGAGAKAIAEFRNATSMAALAASNMGQGVGTMATRVEAGGLAVKSMTTSMLGFVGIAAGILGVAAAIVAVVSAINLMNEAKQKAKLDDLLGDSGFNADQAVRNVRNTELQYNVDPTTGAGAIERYVALQGQLKGAQDEAKRANEEIANLDTADRQLQENLRISAQRLADNRGRLGNVFSTAAGGDSGSRERLVAATTAFAEAPASDYRAAVRAYRDAVRVNIQQNETITNEAKQYALSQVDEQFGILEGLQGSIRTIVQGRIGDLAKNEDLTAGESRTQTLIENILEDTSKAFLSEKDLDKAVELVREQREKFLVAGSRAEASMLDLRDDIILQQTNFIKAAYGSNQAEGQAAADAAKRYLESNDQDYIRLINEYGTDNAGRMKAIFDALEAAGIKVAGVAQEGINALGNVPTIDGAEIREYTAKVFADAYRIAGENATAGMRDAAIAAQRATDTDEFQTQAIETLARASSQNADSSAVKGAVIKLMSERGRASADEIIEGLKAAGATGIGTRNETAIRAAVAALNQGYLNSQASADAQFKSPTASGSSRTIARTIEKLLDLPSQSEMALEREEIALQNRYILNEYFNLPLDAHRKSLDEIRVRFIRDRREVENDFEKFFRDSLAKGTTAALDANLISAFAGRGFSAGGKQFTTEMLNNAETAREYTQAALDAFSAALPAGTPELDQRIANARVVLGELPLRTAGAFEEFNRNMLVAQLEGEQMKRNIEEFEKTFDAEVMIRAFENALDNLRSGPLQIDTTIDLAIKAKVSRVELDAEEALKQLNEAYRQRFADLGVQMTIDAQGRFVPYQPPAPTSAQAAALIPPSLPIAPARAGYNTREAAIGAAGRALQGQGFNVGENAQFGGTGAGHTMSTHNRFAIDVNIPGAGVEADNAENRARMDAVARGYQSQGYRILWNGRIYEPGGDGPGPVIPRQNSRGQAISDHRNHLHIEAPASIVGRGAQAAASDNVIPTQTTPARQEQAAWQSLGFANEAEWKATVDRLIAQQAQEVANIREAAAQKELFFRDPANRAVAQVEIMEGLINRWNELDGAVGNAKARILEVQSSYMTLALAAEQAALPMRMDFNNSTVEQRAALYGTLRDNIIATTAAEIRAKAERDKAAAADAAAAAAAADNVILMNDPERLAELRDIQAEIDAGALDTISRLNTSYAVLKQTTEAIIEGLRTANENGDINPATQMLAGMEAAVLKFKSEIPTGFQTGLDVMMTGLNGFTDIASQAAIGMAGDWRSSAAAVLQSMAQMIAKMLIMAATLQLIRLIPGGSALLSAMDAMSGVSSAVSAGISVGSMNTGIAGRGSATGFRTDGGIMPGRLERSIASNDNGKMFSSSQFLGTSQKSSADRVSGIGAEAMEYSGMGKTSGGGDVYHVRGGDIIIQGNASADDADAIAEAQVKSIGGMMVAQQAEKDRQAYRNRRIGAGGTI